MADSDKAVPKKAALEKEVTPLGNARVQLKPAAKKVTQDELRGFTVVVNHRYEVLIALLICDILLVYSR